VQEAGGCQDEEEEMNDEEDHEDEYMQEL
jgi:hypothetical protein